MPSDRLALVLEDKEVMGMQESAIDHVRVRILPDGRMSRSEAAKYIGRATKTLAQWVVDGRGPKSVRVGGRVYYFKGDLDRFIAGEPDRPSKVP
jgi:hypothetical protein